jgi:hypothetical protein
VIPGKSFDQAISPDANYDKVEFRLWYPEQVKSFRAALVLVPGSNADGRSDVFADKAHDEFIEK